MPEKSRNIVRFTLDPEHPPRLTPAQAKRLETLPIDYSDIPEIPEDFWTQHPPAKREPKQQITLRLDRDVLAFFRAQGAGYQGRMNAVLRSYVQAMTDAAFWRMIHDSRQQPTMSREELDAALHQPRPRRGKK